MNNNEVIPTGAEEITDIAKALEEAGVRLVKYNPESEEVLAGLRFKRDRMAKMSPEKKEEYLKWFTTGLTDEIRAQLNRLMSE